MPVVTAAVMAMVLNVLFGALMISENQINKIAEYDCNYHLDGKQF